MSDYVRNAQQRLAETLANALMLADDLGLALVAIRIEEAMNRLEAERFGSCTSPDDPHTH